jgi:hypothetical protein
MTTAAVRVGVAFVRTDEPSPMHEVALNLFATDGARYVDVYGSAVLIAPGLALTARHNVEIFREKFERARHRGETDGEMQLLAVQTWLAPAATVVHRAERVNDSETAGRRILCSERRGVEWSRHGRLTRHGRGHALVVVGRGSSELRNGGWDYGERSLC